jgi:uncharacterized membrane protein
MSEMRKRTENLAVGAILTAVVVVLQLLGTFIRFGPFAISLVLIPIVIGAAISNYKIGAWLGFVFGVAVLLSGDATAFWVIHPVGTVVTVLLKGALCGLAAGLVYKVIAKWNRYVAVIAAAIVCPVVNTGIFLLGCKVFFMEAIKEWGVANGFTNVAEYMFLGLAGGNFLVELGANVVLSPVIFRIIRAIKKN